jgi:DsbC/DsbD-like thiol-disulfide interchange protein
MPVASKNCSYYAAPMSMLGNRFGRWKLLQLLAVNTLLSLVMPSVMAGNAPVPHANLTLIDAGTADGSLLAGVNIAMEPHIKTYWRMPGDSGLPPVFDWSSSDNLATASVLWPLPKRIADPAGSILGYYDDVIFPVRVTAKDPAKPVHLVLKLDYAVCGELCIPMSGQTELTLSNAKTQQTTDIGPDGERVKAFLARVPPITPLGATLISVTPDPSDANTLLVAAKSPLTDLFLEGPDGWYFGDAKPQAPTLWRVMVLQKPRNGTLAGLPLTLTLVTPTQASETSVTLDASGAIR